MPYDPGPKPMQAPRARTADQAPPDRTPGLDDLLEVAGAGGTVILIFSNQVYLPILENWLTAMHRIGIDNILVVTLDEPTQRQMHTPGALCRLLLCEDDLSALWHRRVALFVAIVQRGYHLNNSDVDVVWLKDPRPEFQLGSDADIVFSQGTLWPIPCWERWQFILCCNLFFLRATGPVRAFMRHWPAHGSDSGDDQVSFDLLLLKRGMEWQIPEPHSIPMPFGVDITCSRQIMRGPADGLRVAVLLQHLISAVHLPNEDAYVLKHCLDRADRPDHPPGAPGARLMGARRSGPAGKMSAQTRTAGGDATPTSGAHPAAGPERVHAAGKGGSAAPCTRASVEVTGTCRGSRLLLGALPVAA